MGEITQNITTIKNTLPIEVTLVAVSKTKPPEAIHEAYEAGQRIFGENKVQELVYKHETLPNDIEWHMIGHLQTNKVKYIAPFISLIHSVDSKKLLEVINAEAKKNDRIIDCLLQVKIAKEDTKYGFSFDDTGEVFRSGILSALSNVRIVGLMGMSTFTDDLDQVRNEFKSLALFFKRIKENNFNNAYFSQISMGMSDDYEIAVEEGSTMVRVGSNIFGKRIYN